MKKRGSVFPRSAGVLLHISSLPGPHGIGDFGPEAYRFADRLAAAGFRWWQVLPLNPTDPFYGNSPYRSISSRALNPLFISPELLVAERLLRPGEINPPDRVRRSRAGTDYPAAARWKAGLLDRALERFRPGPEFARFCAREQGWLAGFALFAALKRRQRGRAWTDWPEELRDRAPAALAAARTRLAREIAREQRVQYLLDRQWQALRAHCRKLGIGIIGDLPIYPDHDSADVWAGRGFFRLDRKGRPRFAAGVPPDYFSRTGQLWGNPVYDWTALARDGFKWWLDRVGRALTLCDILRLDHFRGLVAGWQVPASARTAKHGRWVRGRAARLLAALRDRYCGRRPGLCLPFIAEDLGHITPAVARARRQAGLPGMRVAVFAEDRVPRRFGFDEDNSPHRPDRVPADTVLYSSTHDTNTVRGWLDDEAGPEARRRVKALGPGTGTDGHGPARTVVEACLASRAGLVIIPAQDLLGLGARARMNTPGTTRGNWTWRLPAGLSACDAQAGGLTDALTAGLRRALADAGRA